MITATRHLLSAHERERGWRVRACVCVVLVVFVGLCGWVVHMVDGGCGGREDGVARRFHRQGDGERGTEKKTIAVKSPSRIRAWSMR